MVQSRDDGIRMSALCPWFVDTKIVTDDSDIKKAAEKLTILPVSKVVESFQAIIRNKTDTGKKIHLCSYSNNSLSYQLRSDNCHFAWLSPYSLDDETCVVSHFSRSWSQIVGETAHFNKTARIWKTAARDLDFLNFYPTVHFGFPLVKCPNQIPSMSFLIKNFAT